MSDVGGPDDVGAAAPPSPLRSLRPFALSHHHCGQEKRCVRVGSAHVCRRCLVLYPIAFAVMFLSLGGVHWPNSWDQLLLVLLPAPVAADYVLEQVGIIAYSARRQTVFTIIAAPALGRGFARYLATPNDPALHWMVFGFGGACITSYIIGTRRRAAVREAEFRAEMVWADVDFDNEAEVAATLARLQPVDTTLL